MVAHGLGMSVNGQDYRSNVYLLDGTLQNDFTNGPAGSAAGTALGMESIREFRVETNAYSAEYGRNFGGQINVLTKSGTNTLRGSAYEFHRNDALDAPNYFDVAGKPDFTRNQFGGSLGGPLVRDRLFYFVGYEALRENLGKTISSFVPDDNARLGILPDGPVTINRRRAAVSRRDSARQRAGDRRRPGDAHLRLRPDARSGLLPGPPRLSGRHRAPVLRAATPTTTPMQRLPTDYPQFPRSFISTNQFVTVEYRNVLSDRTLQTAALRLQPHAHRPERRGEPRVAAAAVRRPAAALVGDIDIGGMQRFGPQSSANLRLAQNVYSGQYDLTHTRGGHLLKAGRARRALPRLHDQPDVQPRHLHVRERPRVPREPRRCGSSASARPATSTATGRGRSSAPTRRTTIQLTPTADGQRRPALRRHDDAGGRAAGATRRSST